MTQIADGFGDFFPYTRRNRRLRRLIAFGSGLSVLRSSLQITRSLLGEISGFVGIALLRGFLCSFHLRLTACNFFTGLFRFLGWLRLVERFLTEVIL